MLQASHRQSCYRLEGSALPEQFCGLGVGGEERRRREEEDWVAGMSKMFQVHQCFYICMGLR
jgi:hypothetical protein